MDAVADLHITDQSTIDLGGGLYSPSSLLVIIAIISAVHDLTVPQITIWLQKAHFKKDTLLPIKVW